MLNKIYKLVRYGIAGACGAFVHIGVLFVLTDLAGLFYLLSTTIGFLSAYLVSFFMQKKWTFRNHDNTRLRGQMTLYFLVGASNLVFNALGMRWLVGGLGWHHVLSQVAVSGTIAIWSFLAYRWIFRERFGDKIAVK